MRVPQVIKDEYNKRRRENEAEISRRHEELKIKVPEIADIESEQKMLAFDLGKTAFGGSDNAYKHEAERVRARISDLETLKLKLMRANGFPEDYFDIHYTCSECKDSGYVDSHGGKMCSCLKARILEYQYASSGIKEDECFEKFDLGVYRDEKQRDYMRKTRDFALNYADRLPNVRPQNLLLLGATGLGKTFLLNCIAKRAMENGLYVVKITAYNMFESILSSIRTGSEAPNYISCDLLAIDDLGTEPLLNNITTENLFNIINEREVLEKPMVIASNLSKATLFKHYDERVGSRLLSPKYNSVITLKGDDIRL